MDRHTLQVHKPLFYFQSTHLTEEPKKYCCIFATPREDAMVYATSELKIRLGIEPSLISPRERLLRFAHQHSSCPQRNEANDTVQMTYPFSCSSRNEANDTVPMTYPTIRYRANIIQVISRSIKKNSDSCIKTFAF